VAVTLLITKELEDLRIPYFIGGSLASALFGIIRATRGVDLVADIQSQHVGPLSERLKTSFYVQAEDIHDAIRHRSSFNIIHLETFFKADVFVLKGRVYDRVNFSVDSGMSFQQTQNARPIFVVLKTRFSPNWNGIAWAMKYRSGSGMMCWE
jgi:hypothetical protein